MNVITFRTRPKRPQMSLFWTPVLSGSYDVWGGTHATNPLRTKRIYITFTSYLTEIHETTCFALQVNRPFSLPTVRNQTSSSGAGVQRCRPSHVIRNKLLITMPCKAPHRALFWEIRRKESLTRRYSLLNEWSQTNQLTLILRRSRTGKVWFYTSTSNKRAARPKLYTKSLTRDFKAYV